MADTARRLLSLWVRPKVFAALEERAREHDQQLDDEVRDILESAVAQRAGRLVLLAARARQRTTPAAISNRAGVASIQPARARRSRGS